MLFTTWQFALVFLPVALAVLFLIPARASVLRKLWLTGASLFFYASWRVEYLPLLLLSIAFNFTIAELLNHWRDRPAARTALTIGVAGNLLALAVYKYTNFLIAVFAHAIGRPSAQYAHFDIVLPLAISFFTFTQISYLVDVARDHRLHYGLLDYSLFVSFFPHLVAGPIVRHWEIIPQYAGRTLRFTRENFAVGLSLFLLGLGKKVLLADSAAIYADTIFGAARFGVAVPCLNAWFGAVAFALQIYFDFAGYSDMAIGLARLFDIRFPVNFNSPYRAASVTDFWRRWHITLTRFMREYVYFSLGGNRCSPARQAGNVMLTFFLSGLWHGANWTFVVWGILHGFGLLVHQHWTRLRLRFRWRDEGTAARFAARAITLFFLLFTWVYFRAPSLGMANRLVATMAGANGITRSISLPAGSIGDWLISVFGLGNSASGLPIDAHGILVVGALFGIACIGPNSQQLLARYAPAFDAEKAPARWSIALGFPAGFALGCIAFLVVRAQAAAPPSPFIYFNF